MGAVIAPSGPAVFKLDIVKGTKRNALSASDAAVFGIERRSFYKIAAEIFIYNAAFDIVTNAIATLFKRFAVCYK